MNSKDKTRDGVSTGILPNISIDTKNGDASQSTSQKSSFVDTLPTEMAVLALDPSSTRISEKKESIVGDRNDETHAYATDLRHSHGDMASEASRALQELQKKAVASANETGVQLNGPVDPTQQVKAERSTRIKTNTAGETKCTEVVSTVSEDGNVVEEEVVVEEEEEEDDEEEVEEDEEEEESSEISASDEDGSWIAWFCSLRGNEFFCEVDEDYIQDDFNLTGLNALVPYYDYALDMVLDVEMPMEDSLTEEQQEIVESAAEMLYGLIHARYIVTNRGMHAMYEKYRSAAFGRCPHVFCQGQPVLPVGLSDLPRNYTVNVFCPRCHGLFFPKSTRQANIDGAYFGTTFPHLYLITHPDMIPAKPTQHYQPRVYGFKVHQTSLYYRNHDEYTSHRQVEGRERQSRKSKNRSSGGGR